MNDASLSLFKNGSLAFKQARYGEAITCLERFCQETVNRRSKQFFQAQMCLIQAYHKDHQNPHAIALCEQLTKSEIPQVKQWADKALPKLIGPMSSLATQSESSPISASQTTTYNSPENFSSNAAAAFPTDNNSTAKSTPRRTDSIRRSTSKRSTRHVVSNRSRHVTSAPPKDYTNQVMAALSHGSISALASILLFMFLSNSLAANVLGLLRFGVPLLIFLKTDNQVTKANAQEALNYSLTCLILLVPTIFAVIFLSFLLVTFFPLGLLLALILSVYVVVLSIYPVVATIGCLNKEGRVFRYPNWLILHLIKG